MDKDKPDRQKVSSPSELVQLEKNVLSRSDQLQELCLQVLLPLSSLEILYSCLEHAKKARGGIDVLDLEPLFKSWRCALSTLSIRQGQSIIFDISLPPVSGVSWAHSSVQGRYIVAEEKVSRFVQGIATVMYVKMKREGLGFKLVGFEELRRTANSRQKDRYFEGLEVVLEKMSGRTHPT